MLMFAAIISTVASCACDSILEAHFASSEPIHDFYLNWTIWEYDNYWFIVLAYVLLFSLLTIGFKQIRLSGGLIFLFGFILYFIGYDYDGTGESLWALCSRSTMSSLEMFLGRSDLIEVHHNWHRNAAYMAFFSVTHLCALSVSIMLLFKLFAKRIYYFFKLYFYSYFNSEKTLFLFFGYNENAKILAQDIHGIAWIKTCRNSMPWLWPLHLTYHILNCITPVDNPRILKIETYDTTRNSKTL